MESFTRQLKEIDPLFEVRQNKNSPDISGVYWNGFCAYIAVPTTIKEKKDTGYTDEYGNVHRSAEEALGMAQAFLERMKKDAEFKDLITTDDSRENVTIPTTK